MAITIPDNKLFKPAHDFDEKPGVAKVAITDAGPLSVSSTGSDPAGCALFEPTDGTNNEGYIGIGLIPTPVKSGIGALRNTIMGNFRGVVPGKSVYLGQDGSLTQDTSTLGAPAAAPVLTEGAAGALAAGAYQVSVASVDANGGVGIERAPVSVTITASKKIHIAAYALPVGAVSLNWYLSTGPGSTVRKFIVNTTDGLAFDLNALPSGSAAAPLTSVASPTSRRVGVGFTPFLIAFD
jgi:hypothetical protein